MDFQTAEQRYYDLKQFHSRGQLTQDQFINAVNELRVQAADNSWWQMRWQDGAWLRWDGTNWTPYSPPPAQAPAQAQYTPPRETVPQKKKSRLVSCLLTTGIIVLVLLCLLIIIAGGGYYLYQKGTFTQKELMNLVGMGTGEISIINTREDSIEVHMFRLDTESGSPEENSQLDLAPSAIDGVANIDSGRYRVDFTSGGSSLGSCTMRIKSGDVFQFVIIPEGIAITREDKPPKSAAEINIVTSDLCKP